MKFNDWLKNDDLSAKILICSDVKNGNRLIRKSNKNGIIGVNAVCKQMSDIAREIVIGNAAKNGKLIPFRLLDNSSCAVIIDRLIRNNPDKLPFLKKQSMCAAASADIMRIINVIRMNKVTDGFMSSSEENIVCLKTLITMYHNELASMGAYDSYTLIRSAVDIAEPIKGVSFGLAEGTQLTDIELELLKIISAKSYENIELFQKESLIKPTFFEGRGYINEIRYIAESIKNKPFGEVNIFFTSDAYGSFIKAGLGSRRIPYTLSSSYPASETDIVSFMISLLKWAENGFLHSELENVFINPKMTVYEIYYYKSTSDIMWGIGGYDAYCKKYRAEHPEPDDAEKNRLKLILFYEALVEAFSVPEEKRSPSKLFGQLIRIADEFTYKKNPERKLVMPALKEEAEQLSFMGDDVVSSGEVLRFLIDRLEHMTISEAAKTDAVNVSMIGSGIVSERKYNYICGLSVSDLSPKVTESPVMSDKQLRTYVENPENSETSEIRSQKLYNDLKFLIRSILADKDSELYLGYSSYDLSRLTECPPSVFYKELCEEFGLKVEASFGYDNIILKNIRLPRSKKWQTAAKPSGNTSNNAKSIFTCSPTMLDTAIACPRKFFFRYKLQMWAPEFVEYSGSKWLTPVEKGILFHDAACEYAERVLKGTAPADVAEKADEKLLTEIFNRVVNGYQKPCENPEIRRLETEELKTAFFGYFNDLHKELHSGNNWVVSECEGAFSNGVYTLHYVDPFDTQNPQKTIDLTFEGRVDRIDRYTDKSSGNKYIRVIDYKTTSSSFNDTEHSQHVLYTAALNSGDGKVAEFDYETPFLEQKRTVCKDAAIADFSFKAKEKITDVLVNDKYGYGDKASTCEYCGYADICFKKVREDM